jgi:hypothetical protein
LSRVIKLEMQWFFKTSEALLEIGRSRGTFKDSAKRSQDIDGHVCVGKERNVTSTIMYFPKSGGAISTKRTCASLKDRIWAPTLVEVTKRWSAISRHALSS